VLEVLKRVRLSRVNYTFNLFYLRYRASI